MSTHPSYTAALTAGRNGTERVYITEGAYFRGEKYADECGNVRIPHTGWFTDPEVQWDKLRGVVARLPHGLFLAGYEESVSDLRIWYPQVHYNSERDAALMADEHARIQAESACEHNAKLHGARALEDAIDTDVHRLRECLALRSNPCFKHLRATVHFLVDRIRESREQLTTNYSEYL